MHLTEWQGGRFILDAPFKLPPSNRIDDCERNLNALNRVEILVSLAATPNARTQQV